MDDIGISCLSFMGVAIMFCILGGLEILSLLWVVIGIIGAAAILCTLACTLIPYLDWRKINVSSLKELMGARHDAGRLPSMEEVKRREKNIK